MTRNRDRAKGHRHHPTEAEAFVWGELRNRRFAEFKFRRQFAIGNYIVDFVCLERRVIVELDGGQHNQSREKLYDARRDAWLQEQGFEVLRFWNSDVFTEWEAMAEGIWRVLQQRPAARAMSKSPASAPSPPAPLPRGERGEVE